MNARRMPDLVVTDELPEYPLGRDVRLQAHYFTMIQHHRWLNSELHLTADMAVQGAALNLFLIAQSQSPIGTLPDDDVLLSRLLRLDLTAWQALRNRPMGALHNWYRCLCDGEIRLMHNVVLEVLQDTIAKRDEREASNEEKAVYQRLQRLRRALGDLGCDKSVQADEVLVTRMDAWLLETVRGHRRQHVYAAALDHAVMMGWIAQAARRGR